jgi:Xaa-Pro aminopeptidase
MTLQERLDSYLAANDLEAVWFARPNSFSWLTDGGNNVVSRGGDVGVAAAGYDGTGTTVVTKNIEAPRLRAEELTADVTLETVPWHDQSLADAVAARSPAPAAADFEVPGMADVDAAALRQPLTDGQISTYTELSRDVAEALEIVARRATTSATERKLTGDLRGLLEAEGIDAPVALVGSGDRAQSYRHYTPTDAELGEYALLSVTAERAGQYVSCSRTVTFDPPEWLSERTHDAMRVEATALAATQAVGRDGGTAGDVFEAIQDA